MNYLPYSGYWFYGSLTAEELASYYSSWGLLDTAGELPEEVWREMGILSMLL